MSVCRLGTSVVIAVALASIALAEEGHDKVVYGRYPRTVQASKIKYDFGIKHQELNRPATANDVKEGRALFTFEGLGQSRVWKLPECPNFSHWPNLKLHLAKPEKDINDCGYVCQAEELQINGVWKRYFGYLSRYGAAVVPAAEVELSLPYEPESNLSWEKIGGGVDWGIRIPGGHEGERPPQPGGPAVFEIHLRNRLGDRQLVPTALYRGPKEGGPAFHSGIQVELKYAPFDPRNPDRDSFPNRDFKLIRPVLHAAFQADGAKKELATGESLKAFSFDLNDWLKLDRPGYYQLHFNFDNQALGLSTTPSQSGGTYYVFCIGDEPRQLTIAELNREVEALGGKANREHIARLIREWAPAKDASKANVPSEKEGRWAWSQPVNGLAARIEFTSEKGYAGFVALVQLKNTSDRAFVVPGGNPTDPKSPELFELYARAANRPWNRLSWLSTTRPRYRGEGNGWGNRVDRLPYRLKPGESGLVFLCGDDNEQISKASELKIVLRQPAIADESRWQGVLETPPCPAHVSWEERGNVLGLLPAPTYLPEFSRVGVMGYNMSGHEPMVQRLRMTNGVLIGAMCMYQPAGLAGELEHRFQKEAKTSMHVKLFLAGQAVRAGSREAALYLLEMLNETDYETLREVGSTLAYVASDYERDPPPWLEELILAAVTDHRYATGLEKTNISSPSFFRFPQALEGGLTGRLGDWKSRKAVSALLEIVEAHGGDYWCAHEVIDALGEIGDPRAIKPLMDMLQRRLEGEDAEHRRLSGSDDIAIRALVKLQAKEAVPLLLKLYAINEENAWEGSSEYFRTSGQELILALVEFKVPEAGPMLLKHIDNPAAIRSLSQIKERNAIAALRTIVAAKGKFVQDGKPIRPDEDRERLFAARLALVSFDDDRLPGLCDMLADRSLDELDRKQVVWMLADLRDPRAVPHLLNAIKTDPGGPVVNQAITVLRAFKSKEIVPGLIECFDANFEGKQDWKRAYTPEMFRESIADTLRAITGQSFGPDKQQWQDWWQSNKQSDK